MTVEVLVATMYQNDLSLADKMNISGDVIIANQNDHYEKQVRDNVTMITTSERGVGRNRNLLLMNSTKDICILADDDMKFYDDYIDTVTKAFETLPQADMIIFNIDDESGKNRRANAKIKKLSLFNSLNYGAARIAFRRESIYKKNIFFSLLFGGGAKFSCGEDSIFISDVLKKHLKVYAYPKSLATLCESESTWFKGYNDKFFEDKGALFYSISSRFSLILCLQDAIRHKNLYKRSVKDVLFLMKKGIKKIK